MPLWWGWGKMRKGLSSKEDRRKKEGKEKKKTSRIPSLVTHLLFRTIRKHDQWPQYQHNQPLIHNRWNGLTACANKSAYFKRSKQLLVERSHNVQKKTHRCLRVRSSLKATLKHLSREAIAWRKHARPWISLQLFEASSPKWNTPLIGFRRQPSHKRPLGQGKLQR